MAINDHLADWASEDGTISLCPIAGWQTGSNPELGVALRLSFYATPDEVRREAPSGIQLLLTAAHALELGEELLRQGRSALGSAGQGH